MTSVFKLWVFPEKLQDKFLFCCSTSMPYSTNIPTLAKTSRLCKWSSMPSLTGINSCPSYGIANTAPWKLHWKSVNRDGSSRKWSSCWVSVISTIYIQGYFDLNIQELFTYLNIYITAPPILNFEVEPNLYHSPEMRRPRNYPRNTWKNQDLFNFVYFQKFYKYLDIYMHEINVY